MRLVTRPEWGGPTKFIQRNGDPGAYPVGRSARRGVCFHWDGADAVLGYPYGNVMSKLQADHKVTAGGTWGGVGYNYVVTGDGTIWEGRGLDLTAVACPGHNTDWLHVQLHVGKGDPGATPAQLQAGAELAAWIDSQIGRPLGRYVHSDGYPTECAGRQITTWVRAGCPSPNKTINITSDEEDPLAGYSKEDLIGITAQGAAAVQYGSPDNTWGKWMPVIYNAARNDIPALRAQLAVLTSAVQALAEAKGIDPQPVLDAIQEAGEKAAEKAAAEVARALNGVQATVTLNAGSGQ